MGTSEAMNTIDRELDAAKIFDAQVRRAYAHCALLLARKNHAAQAWMRSLLPVAARAPWDAVFAFCGYADDLSDDPRRSAEDRRRSYDRFAARFFGVHRAAAVHEDTKGAGRHQDAAHTDPAEDTDVADHSEDSDHSENSDQSEDSEDSELLVCLAFSDVLRTWHIGEDSVALASQAVHDDIGVSAYATVADLERYMNGVSGQHAIWVSTVLGLTGPDDAVGTAGATAWGFTLQTLDFLMDLEEDLRLGKLYLPLEDLERCGTSRDEIEHAVTARRATAPLRRTIGLQVDRAEHYLAKAEQWARHAAAPAGQVVLTSLAGARQALDDVARGDNDPFPLMPPPAG